MTTFRAAAGLEGAGCCAAAASATSASAATERNARCERMGPRERVEAFILQALRILRNGAAPSSSTSPQPSTTPNPHGRQLPANRSACVYTFALRPRSSAMSVSPAASARRIARPVGRDTAASTATPATLAF